MLPGRIPGVCTQFPGCLRFQWEDSKECGESLQDHLERIPGTLLDTVPGFVELDL